MFPFRDDLKKSPHVYTNGYHANKGMWRRTEQQQVWGAENAITSVGYCFSP